MPKKKKRTTKKRKDTKKKLVRKKKVTRRKSKSETVAGQEKYHRGGRVEAYTMGEAMGSKKWP